MNKIRWNIIFFWLIIFCVFALSFYIKCWTLIQKYSFDDDEIYSVLFIRNSWSNIFTLNVYDPGNPPLYYIFLKLWTSFMGADEIGVRSFSLLFDFGSFWLLYLIGRRRFKFDNWQIVFTQSLFSFSAVMFYYSLYGRTYSLMVFDCLLTLYFWLERDKSRLFNIGFILSALVGVFLHYTVIFFLIFLGVASLINVVNVKNWHEVKKIIFNYLLVLGIYLPWGVMFLNYQIDDVDMSRKYPFWQFSAGFDYFKTTYLRWVEIFTNGLVDLSSWFSGGLFLMAGFIVVFSLWNMFYKKIPSSYKITIVFVVLYLLSLFVFGLDKLLITERYSLFIFPMVWLVVAMTINTRGSKVLRLFLVMFLLYWATRQNTFYIPVNGHSWKNIASSLNPRGKVYIETCFQLNTLNYYYLGRSEVECQRQIELIGLTKGDVVNILENKFDGVWTGITVENWIHQNNLQVERLIEFNNGYTSMVVSK